MRRDVMTRKCVDRRRGRRHTAHFNQLNFGSQITLITNEVDDGSVYLLTPVASKCAALPTHWRGGSGGGGIQPS